MSGSMATLASARSWALTVALLGASYPLALAGQFAIELLAGDALLIREWQYGSQRTVAAELGRGWIASLPFVVGAWVILVALRRVMRGAYAFVVLAACLVAVAAAVAQAIPLPPVVAWLALACFVLEASGRVFFRRSETAS
jgi:hypothetical protein